MAFFWTKERLLQKNPVRFAYLIVFVTFFLLTEVGRKIYRPFIYRNHIDDFGVADTIGNSLGTLTQIMLYLGLANATTIQGYRIIAFVTLGNRVFGDERLLGSGLMGIGVALAAIDIVRKMMTILSINS